MPPEGAVVAPLTHQVVGRVAADIELAAVDLQTHQVAALQRTQVASRAGA
jgi:hypothetical protein